MKTVAELRAIVGDDGRDLSDETLRQWDLHSARVADVVRRVYLDRVDPAGAPQRRRGSEIAAEELRAKRRAKYERERTDAARPQRRRIA